MGFPHRSPSKGYRFSGVVTTTAFLPVPVNDPLGGPGSDSADAVCETLGRSPISEGRGVSGCRAAQMTGGGSTLDLRGHGPLGYAGRRGTRDPRPVYLSIVYHKKTNCQVFFSSPLQKKFPTITWTYLFL